MYFAVAVVSMRTKVFPVADDEHDRGVRLHQGGHGHPRRTAS
jgi:hypothetical protein